jgi:fatty acid desaturase
VSSRLSTVAIPARRRLAATLALFAALFVAVGVVAATGGGSAAAPVFSAIALVVAVLLALLAWGVHHSVRLDQDEQRLDDAIRRTVAASGASMCDCGHDHDPNELHTTDCAHDGRGDSCAHDCESCVLAGYRGK